MAKKSKKVHIYSALEVARFCGVVNQTAINWIKGGHLKAFTTPGGQYRVYADDLIGFLRFHGMRIPEELAQEAQTEPQVNRTVLIVDDDRQVNEVIRRTIARSLPDFGIEQAFDGFQAGKLVAEWRPAVVVLDVDLPGVDGVQLCRSIKQDPALKGVMVISVTGLDDPDVERAMLAEGADAFLRKPLDLVELAQLIGRFVGRDI